MARFLKDMERLESTFGVKVLCPVQRATLLEKIQWVMILKDMERLESTFGVKVLCPVQRATLLQKIQWVMIHDISPGEEKRTLKLVDTWDLGGWVEQLTANIWQAFCKKKHGIGASWPKSPPSSHGGRRCAGASWSWIACPQLLQVYSMSAGRSRHVITSRHVTSRANVRAQSATERIIPVHTLPMPKPVMTVVFKMQWMGMPHYRHT